MGTAYICVLTLWFIYLVDSTQVCHPTYFTHASTVDNQLFFRRLLWEKNSTKPIECGNFCFREKTCVSFQVNREESVCRGYAVTFNGKSTSDPAPGYMLYEKEKALGFIGSSCQNNTECSVPRSVCVNSECMCDPGLSFSPQSASCNTTCTTYGSHYTEVHGIYIKGHNRVSHTSLSKQQCMDSCTKSAFVCRSADWIPSNDRCDLTDATLLTVHASFYTVLENETTVTHFVRECEL
ncbi:uncharacterized protein [Haliotis cracherodii]|uniref:uncharacterized protein n=1 Tax=Haliotis cracherodii TaxID=6455 RepID=UPI0039E76D0B